MKHPLSRSLIVGLLLTAAVGQAFATPIEITIPDNAPVGGGFTGESTPGGGAGGIAGEDNEVEPGAVLGQQWDVEAMVMNGSILSLVGGYDFLNGLTNGKPGDLFIKVGGGAPGYNPLTSPLPANVTNGAYYDYTYAVDLSSTGTTWTNGFLPGSTTKAFTLNAGSVLQTVQNDNYNSNPWKYVNSNAYTDSTNYGTPFTTLPLSYVTGLSAAQVNAQLGTSLVLDGANHNILQLDLAALGLPVQTHSIWFSYTMECGNDSLKGRVPEGGASLILLGIGLSVMSLARLRRRS